MPSLAPGSQLPLVVGKNNPSARYSKNTQDDSQPGLTKVYWSRPYIGSGMAVLMETDNGIGVDIGDRRINANAIQTHNTPIPSPSLPPPHHHLRQNKFWLQMWNCMYQQYHYVDWADQADWQSSAFPTLLLSVREQKKLCIAFCLVKISPLIRTVFLISAREYFVENQFRLNQIALTATGEGRGRFLPSESGISEPGTPSQVPQPTCFWKWHSWQLGNLTRDPTVGWGPSI